MSAVQSVSPGVVTDIDTGEESQAPAVPKPGRKRMTLIAGGVAALLAAAGGSYALLGGKGADSEVSTNAAVTAPESFVEVPPMTVNLRTPEGATKFLKVRMVLVAGNETPEEITKRLPILLDAFQPFLRELRPDDLTGAAATYRIKEEMLVRANAALGGGSVRDVLIQDLVQQ